MTSASSKDPTRHNVDIKAGETIALCRCWHSKSFPLCDGSHQYLKNSKGPVVVTGKQDD